MNFFKKPAVIIIIVSVLIAGGYLYFKSGESASPDFITVVRGDIVQEVSVIGNVKPVASVDLAFEKSGKISSVSVRVGSYAGAGSVLAAQDDSELNSQLEKSKADLDTQKAELEKTKVSLSNYYSAVPNILNDAYAKADDAVRKQTDIFFTDGESSAPKIKFSSSDSQAQTDTQNGRLTSNAELIAWREELNNVDAALQSALDSELSKSKDRLEVIRVFLLRAMDAVNKAYGLAQATSDSYKANITTGRSNVNVALTNINEQKQSIDLQRAAIAASEASVKSYEAAVKNIESQIAKTVLTSPISGVVTRQDAKIGEIASAGSVLISVLSSSYEIEANIPEVDIAKIKIGDFAKATLDAYGRDVVFDAKVIMIDPAETVIENVATYKTTLRFASAEKPIKSGMTVNIDILTAQKENVLIVPQRAVFQKNGDKFVNVYESSPNGDITKEVKVATGVRGSDGNIEIIEGLEEGDRVVIQ